MISLIFVLSAAALASSQYHHAYPHTYLQHVPIIDHRGVPIDTPEVQAARANHLEALAAASHGSHAGHYITPWAHSAYYGNVLGHYEVPQIAHDGTPLDTAEVQHAKLAHFAAYNEAAGRTAITHVPVDTPEVQLAKAEHFAAHAQHHNRYRRALYYSYPYAHTYPAIGHDGSPIETLEVQAAKAQHFAAHAQARYQHALAPLDYSYGRYAAHSPIIAALGVPDDTPEVKHAKAEHFAAHAEAAGRSHFGTVVPLDTPEVHLAKLQHFAAHAAALHHY